MTLTTKYDRIMESIHTTPALEERILRAAAQPRAKQKPRRTVWLKTAGTLAACLVLVFCGTSLLRQAPEGNEPSAVQGGVPSGMQDFDSIDALAASLPFTLQTPAVLPEGYEFSAAADQFGTAVVIYSNGADSIRFYMSADGDAAEGYYPDAPAHETELATLYGENGVYTAAQWDKDGNSFLLLADAGLGEDAFAEIIRSVR